MVDGRTRNPKQLQWLIRVVVEVEVVLDIGRVLVEEQPRQLVALELFLLDTKPK